MLRRPHHNGRVGRRGADRTAGLPRLTATAALVTCLWIATATFAQTRRGPDVVESAESAFDLARTAFVVTSGAGGDLTGCGAISAIDVESGNVLYRSERRSSRDYLAASEDYRWFASGGGSGSNNVLVLDASDPVPDNWQIRELWTPAGPRRLIDSAVAIRDGSLYLGLTGSSEEGPGLGRIPLARLRNTSELQVPNPVDGLYSTRDRIVQILSDSAGSRLYLLTLEYRQPSDVTDVVESFEMNVHTVDTELLAARVAPLRLPPLVVDEPPGAGLREAGIHNWSQNGRLAYMTFLPDRVGPGPRSALIAVNGLMRREITFAHMRAPQTGIMTATLPADYAFSGAVAGNSAWNNLGLLAVHGGDKIGVFEVDPYAGRMVERGRIGITPVVSPLRDDRRMMPGPVAWSADGSRLIAAGNEGDAEVLIIDVEECGRRLNLRHAVAVCPYADYNGLRGIVTANGELRQPRPGTGTACPTPEWIPPVLPVGSGFSLAIPWSAAHSTD